METEITKEEFNTIYSNPEIKFSDSGDGYKIVGEIIYKTHVEAGEDNYYAEEVTLEDVEDYLLETNFENP